MRSEVAYLTMNEAEMLVDRIADRAEKFDYKMREAEKEAMAQLLSDIGVKVSDLIDVSNLADNYAINSEIVSPEEYKHYDMKEVKQDCLFQWETEGEKYYCLSW